MVLATSPRSLAVLAPLRHASVLAVRSGEAVSELSDGTSPDAISSKRLRLQWQWPPQSDV
jgi:hypothetical protein